MPRLTRPATQPVVHLAANGLSRFALLCLLALLPAFAAEPGPAPAPDLPPVPPPTPRLARAPQPTHPHRPAPPPAQPAPEPAPEQPNLGEELNGEPDQDQGPIHPFEGAIKLTIKREGIEVTLEAPAAMFAADELKDLVAQYLPKPDRDGLGVRVYNLRKLGIDLPAEVLEKLIRKVAKGADEEQAEINFAFDEPNRLILVSAWEPLFLDRVDLLIDALAREKQPGPPGGPGGFGGPGGPNQMFPGGPPGMGQGMGPAQGRGGAQPQPDGGADADLQRRLQQEREELRQKMEPDRRAKDKRDKELRKENPDNREPNNPNNPPAGPEAQF